MIPTMLSVNSIHSDNREQETFSPLDSPTSKSNSPRNSPLRMGLPGLPHTEMCAGLKEEDSPCR